MSVGRVGHAVDAAGLGEDDGARLGTRHLTDAAQMLEDVDDGGGTAGRLTAQQLLLDGLQHGRDGVEGRDKRGERRQWR